MIEENDFGEFSHRATFAIREDRQDTPLLDRHALLPQALIQLTRNLAICPRKKIGELLGDGQVA